MRAFVLSQLSPLFVAFTTCRIQFIKAFLYVKSKTFFMANMQKITPNLWFDNQAEEAVNFYTSIFKNSKIGKVSRYGKEGQEVHKMHEGTVMVMEFWIEDQKFTALNGGPIFKFN